jgi:phosphatidylserine decarboxylase
MPRRKTEPFRLIPIVRDGWRFIIPVFGLTLICLVLGWEIAAALFLAVTLFCAYFFRDPDRPVPIRPGLILSPADGKVISIDEVEIETVDGKRERLRRVGIFLSIFNVHVQRAPSFGTILSTHYTPGKFLNALNDKASEENENNMIWMETAMGTVGVRQIAGIIARRVVCRCRPRQNVLAGQRIGLIRFGSRAEAYFPLEARVLTRVGRNVQAGLSILAEMPAARSASQTPEPLR